MKTRKYVIEVIQDDDKDESDDLRYYIEGVIPDLVSIEPLEED